MLAGWSPLTKTRWAKRARRPPWNIHTRHICTADAQIQTVYKHVHTSYISLEHKCMHKNVFSLPVGGPSQSDMARRVSSLVSWVSAECCLLWSGTSLFLLVTRLTTLSYFTLCLIVLPLSLPLSKQSDQWPADMPFKHRTLSHWILNL